MKTTVNDPDLLAAERDALIARIDKALALEPGHCAQCTVEDFHRALTEGA